MDSIESKAVLIAGAGLAGMSVASVLGSAATVLESGTAVGGLVQSVCHDGYWYDRVIHLLYLPDERTLELSRVLLADDFVHCTPDAWVETAAGTVRYPFQLNLGDLPEAAREACLQGFVEADRLAMKSSEPIVNYEEMLLRTFGQAMCELFHYPYNRKMWKRPLSTLAPVGFQWNIQRPQLADILQGSQSGKKKTIPYNQNGWYPQPVQSSPIRGMGLLSERLRRQCHDIRLGHRVTDLDLESRRVTAVAGGHQPVFHFERHCILTMPLPAAITICRQSPHDLRDAVGRLRWMRVRSVAINVRGPRPQGCGRWRYYTDETLVFSRLVFMHEFDAAMAPPEGWPLLVEVTEPAETPPIPDNSLFERVLSDIRRTGILPKGSEIIGMNTWTCDPAYVVFTPESQDIIAQSCSFLASNGVSMLGRYGCWAYSSMGQVMRDGFALGESLALSLRTGEDTGVQAC